MLFTSRVGALRFRFRASVVAAILLLLGSPIAAGSGPTPPFLVVKKSITLLIDQINGEVTGCTGLVDQTGKPVGECALLGSIAPDTSATPLLAAATVGGGVFLIDQVAGRVSACVGLVNSSNLAPVGGCTMLGSIPPNRSGTPLTLKTAVDQDIAELILNEHTGNVAVCGLIVNAATNAPIGGCLSSAGTIPVRPGDTLTTASDGFAILVVNLNNGHALECSTVLSTSGLPVSECATLR